MRSESAQLGLFEPQMNFAGAEPRFTFRMEWGWHAWIFVMENLCGGREIYKVFGSFGHCTNDWDGVVDLVEFYLMKING